VRRPAPATGSCQAGRRPDDLAVAAVLLRCHLVFGGDFLLHGDGGGDSDWLCGVRPGQPGARVPPAKLFAPIPDPSPLDWPIPRLV
jgi:hypothetical protein